MFSPLVRGKPAAAAGLIARNLAQEWGNVISPRQVFPWRGPAVAGSMVWKTFCAMPESGRIFSRKTGNPGKQDPFPFC
jgi:hypothetical protein